MKRLRRSIALVSRVFWVLVMRQHNCDVGCLHVDVVVDKRVVENGEVVALNTHERHAKRDNLRVSNGSSVCFLTVFVLAGA